MAFLKGANRLLLLIGHRDATTFTAKGRHLNQLNDGILLLHFIPFFMLMRSLAVQMALNLRLFGVCESIVIVFIKVRWYMKCIIVVLVKVYIRERNVL